MEDFETVTNGRMHYQISYKRFQTIADLFEDNIQNTKENTFFVTRVFTDFPLKREKMNVQSVNC